MCRKKYCGSPNRKNGIFLQFLRVFGHFLQFESLVFAGISYDGSLGWSQRTSTAKCVEKKYCGSPNRKNRIFLRFLRVFGHFLEFESLVFAEIAYDGSLGWSQHTTSGKRAGKKYCGSPNGKNRIFCGF